MWIRLKPEDWKKVKMKDIIEYNKRYWLKSWDWKKQGKYPFLNSSQKITLYYDEAFYKDKEYLVVWTWWQELILHYMNQPFSASNDNFVLTVKNNILTKYVYYALLSQKDFIDTLYIWWWGIKHINQTRFNSIEILVPPLETQKQIVSYLDQQWEKIQSMEENLKKYANEVKKLEESILDGVFGEMKKYKEVKIEEIFKIKSWKNLTASEMVNDGLYYVYWWNWVVWKYNNFNLEWKNIIIWRVWAQCWNVRLVNGKIWVTDNAFYISELFIKNISKEYLKYALLFLDLWKYSNSATIPVISYKSIKWLKLPLPSLETQQQIVYYLDKQFNHINKLKENIKKQQKNIDYLKKALLNEIFDVVDEKELTK